MSYNGSGTFQINTAGQPVVTGTTITSTAFNALTADLATGLSTAITKDGQTATTARILFALGISSTLTTDATSATTGSIITAGGISTQKALWVGTTTTLAGALTYGGVTLSNAVTGTGNMVLSSSPTLVAPVLGTPASGNLSNCTGFSLSGVSGTLPVANGGTGSTTAADARTALSVPSTTGSGASGTWSIAITGNAGTATTATTATNLSGGTVAATTITATGNITAYYSDDRLKTRLGSIDGALAKVLSLSGFYYEANETAQALGYEPIREVGLSAQDVQAVMPEVIAPAPIDPQYLTLDYARLVPLLVEAIKEQQVLIDALNAKVNAE
jgi:hypothetical protein